MTGLVISPRVTVLGAGGLHGAHIVRALGDRGIWVRAAVHRREQEASLWTSGVAEVATADYEDEEALDRVLAGSSAVYVIPPALHPAEDTLAANAFAAAERAGVDHIVYVSVLHPHTPALAHHMRKAAAEATLRGGAIRWTILQPGIYAQMALRMLSGDVDGVVQVPFRVESPLAVVDLRDVAAVAVRVLIETGHGYASYEIVGSVTSMGAMAEELGEARGRPLRAVRVDPQEAALPPTFPDGSSQGSDMRRMFAEYDARGLVGNSRILTLLLERQPTRFGDVLMPAA